VQLKVRFYQSPHLNNCTMMQNLHDHFEVYLDRVLSDQVHSLSIEVSSHKL